MLKKLFSASDAPYDDLCDDDRPCDGLCRDVCDLYRGDGPCRDDGLYRSSTCGDDANPSRDRGRSAFLLRILK